MIFKLFLSNDSLLPNCYYDHHQQIKNRYVDMLNFELFSDCNCQILVFLFSTTDFQSGADNTRVVDMYVLVPGYMSECCDITVDVH